MGAKLTIAMIACFAALPAMANDTDDWIKDTDCIGKSNHGVIRNDQILELGVPTASALQFEGESSMRMGDVDRALVVLQRSIEMAPMDMDKRILYAEALEKKLMGQKKKDPQLYNFLIKQWLFVARKAEFPDQSVLARSHILSLSGTFPKMLEKPEKFLGRVLIPEDGSQPVLIGGRPHRKQLADKTNNPVNKGRFE